MSKTQRLMILGTASNVGKSSIALALTRWLKQEGRKVVPFKTMSVGYEAYRVSSGEEIHVHQAQQSAAAGLDPTVDMNPVMFKTSAEGEPLILVGGIPSSALTNATLDERTQFLRTAISDAYGRLSNQYDFIVLEGCGSPVELNVKARDLANLWAAEAFDAPCLLVANVENVGAFGSLIGTLDLMTEAERERIIGFIINKFHGDPDDFAEGVRILQERTGLSCLGVIPFVDNMQMIGRDVPLDEATLASTAFRAEIESWTQHVISHLDSALLRTAVLGAGRSAHTTPTKQEDLSAYPNFELVWQGRIQLGDEPGVFGDAEFAGLRVELPFNIEVSESHGSTKILIHIEAENVHSFSPYPGHKASVVYHYPLDPNNVNGKWGQKILSTGFLTSDSLNIPVDLSHIKERLIFVSLRLEVDTTVRAGLYNDFVFKKLGKRAADFKYSTSFGFMVPR
jgi:adenosylcobyric acid synthase